MARMTARDKKVEKYCECGVFGHAWDEDAWEGSSWQPEFGWPLVTRCTRCTSERRDTISSIGDVIQRNYWYPDDYSYKGEDRPTRAEFRLALKRKRERQARERGNSNVIPFSG